MNTSSTGLPALSALQSAMDAEVNRLGGIDEAIAACDRMYSADFRSEPEKLSSVGDWEDETSHLKISLAVRLYAANEGVQLPEKPSDEDHWSDDDEVGEMYYSSCDSYYHEMEAFEESAEQWFDKQYPNFEITGDTLIIQICNYKGEGEGFELYDTHKHLPVFRSKRESFGQVNGGF